MTSTVQTSIVIGRKIEDALSEYFLSLHMREQYSLIGTSEYNSNLVPKYVIEITENSCISKAKLVMPTGAYYHNGPGNFGGYPGSQPRDQTIALSGISIASISDELFEVTFTLPQERGHPYLTNTRVYSLNQFDVCVNVVKELMFAVIISEEHQGPVRFVQAGSLESTYTAVPEENAFSNPQRRRSRVNT